uniref:Cytochrome c oxidase subunit 2 n=1 Tax=Amyrsidea minuta TaxID=2364307 RepID=A0A386B2B3_9NEOP|nr:cytochrome c oxidase subunit II [Amyrsidea minuta]
MLSLLTSWGLIGLQNAASSLMEQMIFFYDHTMFFLILILSVVSYFLLYICMGKFSDKFLLFSESIEIIWIMLPGVILGLIALPSLKVLYLSDESISPLLTVKAMGHQWYWSYEYADFPSITFDSYQLNESIVDWFRLLDVDNRMMVPINSNIRMIISSTDVIHAWTVPSMGVKVDANPGRLNQICFESKHLGLFYGQCSEMCGLMHSFMPICVEVIPKDFFSNWVLKETN